MTDVIVLPPPPATLAEAMRQANDLAYGFAKHVDPAYWESGVGFQGDPVYYWKRMLGWQLKEDSPDRALFGLYAFPPSPWRVPVVSLPAGVPDVPPTTATDAQLFTLNTKLDAAIDNLADLNARVAALEGRLVALQTQLTTSALRPWPSYSTRLLGATLILTPVVVPK